MYGRLRQLNQIYFLLLVMIGSCKTLPQNPSEEKATPINRRLLGLAKPYKGTSIDERALADYGKQRKLAWEIVAKIVQEVPISLDPDVDPSLQNTTVPLFQTWYDSSDFPYLLDTLHNGLSPQEQRGYTRFCTPEITDAFRRQTEREPIGLGFPPDRYRKRLAQLRNLEDIRGVSGIGGTLFSPAVFWNYLYNYPDIYHCAAQSEYLKASDDWQSRPSFAPCLNTEFPGGPHLPPPQLEQQPQCAPSFYDQTQLGTSVAIKTNWQPTYVMQENKTVAAEIGVFPTDHLAMAQHFQQTKWLPQSTYKSDQIPAENIYTVHFYANENRRLPQRYQMPAMHMITKDLRHWFWISLWWTPPEIKDLDFGADRPKDLPAPWSNYKMCVVTSFDAPVLSKDFAQQYPTLAAALQTVNQHTKPQSWCSNPFIEQGQGNALTNCVGCHQHAGSNEAAEGLQNRFPNHSRSQVRYNFPADYLWSMDASPDVFRTSIKDTVDRNIATQR